MLFKNAIGVEGSLGIYHLLKGDRFLFASASLWLCAFPLSYFAICAGCFVQLGNLPSCFQRCPDSLDSVMTGSSLFSNLSTAFGWVSFQQRGDYLTSLVGTEVAAVNVGTDDVALGISINASEVLKGWLDPC